jgi:hypothetical protein
VMRRVSAPGAASVQKPASPLSSDGGNAIALGMVPAERDAGNPEPRALAGVLYR